MENLVPLGTGNSRLMKSNIPASTTLAQLIQMWNNGTFPYDIGPLNSAGISQQGTPLNKDTLLKDATAALYGLTNTAVPDDVLRRVLQTIPSTHGVLTVKCSDTEGGTLSKGISVSVSPAINGQSVFEINSTGVLSVLAPTNTYTVSLDVGYFYEASGATSQQVAVQQQQVAPLATFSVSKKRSGYLKITESKSVVFPDFIVNGDCWGIGGGGSGGVAKAGKEDNAVASGGAGGKTSTRMTYALAGKTLVFNIGAGGKGVKVINRTDGENGNQGGNTSILVNGSTLIRAFGGGGGLHDEGPAQDQIDGASGGSGSGGAGADRERSKVGASGANGGSGEAVHTVNADAKGGTGQGTTTLPFGDSSYGLFGAAGGGAAIDGYGKGYKSTADGGDASASSGVVSYLTNSGDLKSEDAQPNSGSGSGGAAMTSIYGGSVESGNGADGCAIVRWPAQ